MGGDFGFALRAAGRSDGLAAGDGMVELTDVRLELYELMGWSSSDVPAAGSATRFDLDRLLQ